MMHVRPVTGSIGAEIGGLDLCRPLSPEDAGALRQLLMRHQVLFCRQQFLTIPQQKRLNVVFGPLYRLPYVQALADEPDVIAVLKEATETNVGVFGGDWHSDFSFLKIPPAGSILSAVEIPVVGGDTLWANQIHALANLPTELRRKIAGETAVHIGKPYGQAEAPAMASRAGASMRISRGDPAADQEVFHPLIRTHPESGQEALFVNPIYTTRIAGFDAVESSAVLAELYHYAWQPEVCCRWQWQAGDVVIWDNRTTLHYAVNDYDGYRRLLHRTTFSDRLPPA